jgi:hypothetical protein
VIPAFLPIGKGEPHWEDFLLPVGKAARFLLTRRLASDVAWRGNGGPRNGTAPPSRPEDMTNAQTDAESTGPGRQIVAARKWRGEREPIKMSKSDEQSRNVYENKQKYGTLPEAKADISTQVRRILHKTTRILQKPSAFLSDARSTASHKVSFTIRLPVAECRQMLG